MSTEAKPAESKDAPAADGAAAVAAPKKPSAIGGFLKILFPALLAAGAAYGGTMRGAAAHPAAGGHEEAAHEEKHAEPPGPTLPLEPFLITYLRTQSYEQVTGDPTTVDKIRVELLERCKSSGAATATRVLVTDFVIQ